MNLPSIDVELVIKLRLALSWKDAFKLRVMGPASAKLLIDQLLSDLKPVLETAVKP